MKKETWSATFVEIVLGFIPRGSRKQRRIFFGALGALTLAMAVGFVGYLAYEIVAHPCVRTIRTMCPSDACSVYLLEPDGGARCLQYDNARYECDVCVKWKGK